MGVQVSREGKELSVEVEAGKQSEQGGLRVSMRQHCHHTSIIHQSITQTSFMSRVVTATNDIDIDILCKLT